MSADSDIQTAEKPKSAISRRVNELMKQHDLSGRKVAKIIGRSESYMSTLTAGKTKKPDTDTITALSRVFGENLLVFVDADADVSEETWSQLISQANMFPADLIKIPHHGSAAAQPDFVMRPTPTSPPVAIEIKRHQPVEQVMNEALPLVGIVEAGAWRSREEFGDATDRVVELIRDPRFPKARQEAHEVRGDSMNRAGFFEGGFVRMIHLSDAPISLRTGMIVIVERRLQQGGLVERTLKAVEIGDNRTYRLCPRSTNPKHETIEIEATADLLDETAEVVVLGFVTAYINPIPY